VQLRVRGLLWVRVGLLGCGTSARTGNEVLSLLLGCNAGMGVGARPEHGAHSPCASACARHK